MHVDLFIHSAAQLLTLASDGPKRGAAMEELGIIEHGAVAVKDGLIGLVGPTSELRGQVTAAEEIDAAGKVVMPGFVDPHTHLVFVSDRADEFEQRIKGATYMEIMAAGGGIMNTVRATRAASLDELVAQARERLDEMLAHGTTTAEAKTGYGLDIENELKMLEAIWILDKAHPIDLIPTLLGAHAVPTEYQGRAEEYVDLVIDEMLPLVVQRGLEELWGRKEEAPAAPPLFCDVFCEEGVFTLEESRRILTRAKELGLGLKIHADEFSSLGGAALAAELGTIAVAHLLCTPPEEMALLAEAGTIAVLLPGGTFGLGQRAYADARGLIAAGVPVALGTDLNPGTCWCESMQLIAALACRFMEMTPAEAIVAATINAAHAVRLGDQVGSLEVGKKADILILDIPDYRHLSYRFGVNLVDKVIKGGGGSAVPSATLRTGLTTGPVVGGLHLA